MGGFAALSCSDVVHAVMAFGPQIDLESSSYRPSYTSPALREAVDCMRKAISDRKRSVEVHTSMDAHLYQSSLLHPLPVSPGFLATASDSPARHDLRLVVHPFKGRCARVLERADLLLPLLAQTLRRLQCEVKPEVCNLHEECLLRPSENEWPSWTWPYGEQPGTTMASPRLLVTVWRNWVRKLDRTAGTSKWLPATMKTVRVTPAELRMLAQNTAYPGDWLCLKCAHRNVSRAPRCRGCDNVAVLEQPDEVVYFPGGDNGPFRTGDWVCANCDSLEYQRNCACSTCGKVRDLENSCADTGCRSPPEAVRAQGLERDADSGKLYCKCCWERWKRYQAQRAT